MNINNIEEKNTAEAITAPAEFPAPADTPPEAENSLPTCSELDVRALGIFSLIKGALGLNAKFNDDHWYYRSNHTKPDGTQQTLLVNRATGQWEVAGSNPNDASGCDITSLAGFLWGLSEERTVERLEHLVTCAESKVGLEDFPQFELLREADCEQIFPTKDVTPALPSHLGWLDEPARDFMLCDSTGRTLGCNRLIVDFGQRNPITGLGKLHHFMMTCWQSSEGGVGWKNQPLSPPYQLYGAERLAENRHSPVILATDEWSADHAEGLFGRSIPDVIAVGLVTAPDTLTLTDLSALAGRKVYILANDAAKEQELKRKLLSMTPSARVSTISTTIDLDKPTDLDDGSGADYSIENSELITSSIGIEEGWSLPEYIYARTNNRWRLKWSFPTPERRDEVKNFGNFVVKEEGIYVERFKDGEPRLTRISSKIDVTSRARSSESTDWGVCVELDDHAGVTHRWCIPQSDLSGDGDFTRKLLSLGAYVTPGADNRRLLADYLLQHPTKRLARAVFKPGWNDDIFVFPDGSHIGKAESLISYQTSNPTGHSFNEKGSLSDWRRTVASSCEGNSRLILAIATALTGPILPLLGEESGGFHFPGASSTGKTTALHVACSVWGNPDGFITRWRGTANGVEANAVLRNHTLYAMDEMSQVSPDEAGQIVYMLANGQGKIRAQQDATAKPISSWQLMILSTGEVGLEQHLASAGLKVMAGQQARLIDISADAQHGFGIFENIHGMDGGAAFSLHLKQLSSRCYGAAGRAWVEKLANKPGQTAILDVIRREMDKFVSQVPEGADGQIHRVARRFGLVAGVAEAAINEGIVGWRSGGGRDAIALCFRQWLDHRGGTGNLESQQILNQLCRILTEHGSSAFTELAREGVEVASDRVTIRRLGFRQQGADGVTDYYILPVMFKEEVCRGLDARQAVKMLVRLNALVLASDGKAQVTKRLPGIGPTRVYHVRSTVLNLITTAP